MAENKAVEENFVAVELENAADGEEVHRRESLNEMACKNSEQLCMTVQNLVYQVPVKDPQTKEVSQKHILDGINAIFEPGKVTAIMGPSGCGKSTFLDSLSGRIVGDNLSGDVLLNGYPRDDYRGKYAYVLQGDALVGTMTVRENLLFSAKMRSNGEMSDEQLHHRVDMIIDALGLRRVADTRVGTALLRGVSGGEKRRVSIGVEMVTCPSLLFLDEPTSGLDSSAAYFVVESLKRVAETGRAIVMTIHQPATEVFNMIDNLVLLSRGKLVYCGPREGALQHFEACNNPVPSLTNPADHYLRVIATDFDKGDIGTKRVQELVDGFKESEQMSENKGKIEKVVQEGKAAKLDVKPVKAEFAASWGRQLGLLSLRNFRYFTRDPAIFGMRLGMYAMLSLCLGTIYYDLGFGASDIQDRISVLFFTVAFLTFMAISALPAMITEREIFFRERLNHNYTVSAYTLSNFLVSLPFLFVTSLITTAIMYYMIGLHSGAESFFYFMLLLFLALAVAESMMTAIGSISPSFFVGLAAAAGWLGLQMLCSGFFRFRSQLPPFWEQVRYVAYHSYALEGFMNNEFQGLTFTDATFVGGTRTGEEVIAQWDMDGVNKWHDVPILISMAIIYRFITYLLLRYFQKGTRK